MVVISLTAPREEIENAFSPRNRLEAIVNSAGYPRVNGNPQLRDVDAYREYIDGLRSQEGYTNAVADIDSFVKFALNQLEGVQNSSDGGRNLFRVQLTKLDLRLNLLEKKHRHFFDLGVLDNFAPQLSYISSVIESIKEAGSVVNILTERMNGIEQLHPAQYSNPDEFRNRIKEVDAHRKSYINSLDAFTRKIVENGSFRDVLSRIDGIYDRLNESYRRDRESLEFLHSARVNLVRVDNRSIIALEDGLKNFVREFREKQAENPYLAEYIREHRNSEFGEIQEAYREKRHRLQKAEKGAIKIATDYGNFLKEMESRKLSEFGSLLQRIHDYQNNIDSDSLEFLEHKSKTNKRYAIADDFNSRLDHYRLKHEDLKYDSENLLERLKNIASTLNGITDDRELIDYFESDHLRIRLNGFASKKEDIFGYLTQNYGKDFNDQKNAISVAKKRHGALKRKYADAAFADAEVYIKGLYNLHGSELENRLSDLVERLEKDASFNHVLYNGDEWSDLKNRKAAIEADIDDLRNSDIKSLRRGYVNFNSFTGRMKKRYSSVKDGSLAYEVASVFYSNAASNPWSSRLKNANILLSSDREVSSVDEISLIDELYGMLNRKLSKEIAYRRHLNRNGLDADLAKFDEWEYLLVELGTNLEKKKTEYWLREASAAENLLTDSRTVMSREELESFAGFFSRMPHDGVYAEAYENGKRALEYHRRLRVLEDRGELSHSTGFTAKIKPLPERKKYSTQLAPIQEPFINLDYASLEARFGQEVSEEAEVVELPRKKYERGSRPVSRRGFFAGALKTAAALTLSFPLFQKSAGGNYYAPPNNSQEEELARLENERFRKSKELYNSFQQLISNAQDPYKIVIQELDASGIKAVRINDIGRGLNNIIVVDRDSLNELIIKAVGKTISNNGPVLTSYASVIYGKEGEFLKDVRGFQWDYTSGVFGEAGNSAIDFNSTILAVPNLEQKIEGLKSTFRDVIVTPFKGEDGNSVSSARGRRPDPLNPVRMEDHLGTDIYPIFWNDKIQAPIGGKIVEIGYEGRFVGYGNYVRIENDKGDAALIAHCKRILKKVGDDVYRGDKVAIMGDTGRTTGYHAHLEVWKNGKIVDPFRDGMVTPEEIMDYIDRTFISENMPNFKVKQRRLSYIHQNQSPLAAFFRQKGPEFVQYQSPQQQYRASKEVQAGGAGGGG